MKKLSYIVMPLMAISLLASCSQPTPTPVVDVAHTFHFLGTNCTINGESDYSHDIFEKDKNVQYTIVPNDGYKLPETVEGVEYDPTNGVITISEIKSDIVLRVEAIHIGITHTIHLDPAGGTITGDTILKNLPDGEPVTTAPTISRDGYDASQVKWYTEPNGGGQEFKFGPKGTGTNVVTDYFLHAKWGNIKQYTVHFKDIDSKTEISATQTVNYNDRAQRPSTPTKAGYTFDDWYTSEDKTEKYTFPRLTGDQQEIEVWGCFTVSPVTTYTLTFNCTNCEAYDENENKVTSVQVTVGQYKTYGKFHFKSTEEYKNPPSSMISVVKSGTAEEVDFDYDLKTGTIEIPLTSNLTITAEGINKKLENYTWEEISEISNAGLADEYFDIYDPNEPELNCKKVQLKHQDINQDGCDVISEGEVYQTVRIIDFNKDVDVDGNPIGITFEFADLLCDANGNSLALQWNDSGEILPAKNYLDSTIRKALNGTGGATHFLWAEKEQTTWSTTYTQTVLDMLPNGGDSLVDVLKAPRKYVSCLDNDESEIWTDKIIQTGGVYDKLFLLSPREMGYDDDLQESSEHTSPYEYYKNCTEVSDLKRMKTQIDVTEEFNPMDPTPIIIDDPTSEQEYHNAVFNYAGTHMSFFEENPPAGVYTSRSPCTIHSGDGIPAGSLIWNSLDNGMINYELTACSEAVPIAPAFCI